MRDLIVIREFSSQLGLHLDLAKLIWRRYLNVRDHVYLAYALGHLKIQMKPRMIKTALYHLRDPCFADFLARIGCWSYPWVKRRVSDMLEPLALVSSINAMLIRGDERNFRIERMHQQTFIAEFLEWSLLTHQWYYLKKLCRMLPFRLLECIASRQMAAIFCASPITLSELPKGMDLDPKGKYLLGNIREAGKLLEMRVKIHPEVFERLREQGCPNKAWRLHEHYNTYMISKHEMTTRPCCEHSFMAH